MNYSKRTKPKGILTMKQTTTHINPIKVNMKQNPAV